MGGGGWRFIGASTGDLELGTKHLDSMTARCCKSTKTEAGRNRKVLQRIERIMNMQEDLEVALPSLGEPELRLQKNANRGLFVLRMN